MGLMGPSEGRHKTERRRRATMLALLLTPSMKSAHAPAKDLVLGTAPPSGQVAPSHLRGSSISRVSAVPTRSADTDCMAAAGGGRDQQVST